MHNLFNDVMLKRTSVLCLCLCLAAAPLLAQTRQPVLLISIDGMRPDYVTQATRHHLRIPTLRHMMAEGAYAEGVQGVFPTVTYPSHTTIITGVWPDRHGITNNTRFDPLHQLSGAWYWYADQIKVPTLWSAAHAAGLSTASVSWPVTVDATTIDDNIPEYWRSASPADAFNPDDRFLMNVISRPDGEVKRIAARTGTAYMMGNETTLAGDRIRTAYSLDILRQHRPWFMTVHLSSLDEEEHLHGPFSAEADADLEGNDGMIAQLAAQEQANYPGAIIAVVSDHGFANVDHALNLTIPFVEAGLIQIGKNPLGASTVQSWKAEPWAAGGMAAIMLRNPADTVTRDKVQAILQKLAADPANGIEAILDHDAVAALGGFPDATFVVTLKPGFVPGPAISGPLVTVPLVKGTHGYNPATAPEMRASFFITGQGIARGKNLGLIDMRQIAPTLAGILGVSLPTAHQPSLPVR